MLYKMKFYSRGVISNLFPKSFFEKQYTSLFKGFSSKELDDMHQRANYYNKLEKTFNLDEKAIDFKFLHLGYCNSSYYYDFKEILRYISGEPRFNCIFGDVKEIPEYPSIVKARLINEYNSNSVLLKLNKVRHFRFINDSIDFEKKANIAVFRGSCYQQQRQDFIYKHYLTPLTNIGDTREELKDKFGYKHRMTIKDQLKNKFIISIEGHDVATNLKWILNSNSLCFMKKPLVESWFMEGNLKPNFHYVVLKDDYSDLEEKIQYFIDNREEARFILHNAKTHCDIFKDLKKERLISLLVLEKYISYTLDK
ncbi:hypothetical protein ASE99_23515 [Serratia sp. Leaf51]|nr:hypothetical protein ASE99_23515 [Serratia sp. Leaf51]